MNNNLTDLKRIHLKLIDCKIDDNDMYVLDCENHYKLYIQLSDETKLHLFTPILFASIKNAKKYIKSVANQQ
jgi:hypothetical protein